MNMLKTSYMDKHINKLGVLEIVTKTKNYAPNLQKHGGCPTKPP